MTTALCSILSSNAGIPMGRIRRHHWYYDRAKTPLCHPVALRFLRLTVPSFFLFIRLSCHAPERKDHRRPGPFRVRLVGYPVP